MEKLTKQCNQCLAPFTYTRKPGNPGPLYCDPCRIVHLEASRQRSKQRQRDMRGAATKEQANAGPLH